MFDIKEIRSQIQQFYPQFKCKSTFVEIGEGVLSGALRYGSGGSESDFIPTQVVQ